MIQSLIHIQPQVLTINKDGDEISHLLSHIIVTLHDNYIRILLSMEHQIQIYLYELAAAGC